MTATETPAASPDTGQQPVVAGPHHQGSPAEQPPTGPQPVLPGLDSSHPATPADSEFQGATLGEIASLVGNLSAIVRADLIAEIRCFANTLTLVDVEVHAVSPEAAARICMALPWDPRQHVEPGAEYDHYLHEGILWDLRVRIVGLEKLPTGPIVLPAGSTPAGWGPIGTGTDR